MKYPSSLAQIVLAVELSQPGLSPSPAQLVRRESFIEILVYHSQFLWLEVIFLQALTGQWISCNDISSMANDLTMLSHQLLIENKL